MRLLRIACLLLPVILLASCKGSEKGSLTKFEESFKGADHFEHDGIKVYHRKTGSDVISVKLFIRGGTANYAQRFEGIEFLALRIAVEGGTLLYSPEDYRDRARTLGANIRVGRPGLDYSVLSMKCVTENFSAGWDMLTQPLINPVFKAQYFEAFRDEQLQTIAMINQSRRALVIDGRRSLFADRNYSKIPMGNIEAMEYVSAAEVSDFFQSLVTKDRIFVVVNGFVDREKIIEKIDLTIADLPTGFFDGKDQFMKPQGKSTVTVMKEDEELSGMAAAFPGPKGGTKNAIAMRLAMMVLHDRLTEGQATNVAAIFNEARQSYNTIVAFGGDANRTMESVVHELQLMRDEGVHKEELDAQKLRLITERSMLAEEMEGQSHLMGLSAINGNWTASLRFQDYFDDLDKKAVDRVFRKWCKGIAWTLHGTSETINQEELLVPIHSKK